MNYIEPKTDWKDNNLPTLSDFDRIERNLFYLFNLLG